MSMCSLKCSGEGGMLWLVNNIAGVFCVRP